LAIEHRALRSNLQDSARSIHQPLFDLISQSRAVHLQHWRGEEIQRCTLLSIKTGGCSEDCAYCAQSAHYSTGLEREDLSADLDVALLRDLGLQNQEVTAS